jgi:hypothetical protein
MRHRPSNYTDSDNKSKAFGTSTTPNIRVDSGPENNPMRNEANLLSGISSGHSTSAIIEDNPSHHIPNAVVNSE